MPKLIAIDIETSGLYPIKGSKIFCCAVNDGKTIKVETNIAKLKTILEDKNTTKIIHNASFDSFWLKRHYNIEVQNIWDTMIMERIIIGDNLMSEENATEEQKMELSASLFYTLKRYGLPTHDKAMSYNFSVRPINKPLTTEEIDYAKSDVRHLIMLKAMQEIRLAKLHLTQLASLENKVVEVLVRMRDNGIGIDVKRWLQIEKENIEKAHAIQKRLPSRVENWNSPVQVKKYFNSVGIPMKSLEDITPDFQKQYNNPALDMFVEMRWLSTNISKYGRNFLYSKKKKNKGEDRYLVDEDSRIRANFFQVLNTGRLSCFTPPLHGLPREGEQRGAIVARKGYVLLDGDFGGQETGIMAAASGEELWIKALLRGEDPLSLMASLMFKDWVGLTDTGCTFPKKCKCQGHKVLRQMSKEITYGIAYGAYPKSISVKINRTIKETSRLFLKHKKAAPKLNRWLEKNSKETMATRVSYSADVYRRRRTVRDPFEWMVRNVGFNNPVQSCAANMIKLAMVSLDRKWMQVLPWHDALILEVKKADAKKAAKELKIIMEKAADYCTGIPGLIKVEPKISTSLAKE